MGFSIEIRTPFASSFSDGSALIGVNVSLEQNSGIDIEEWVYFSQGRWSVKEKVSPPRMPNYRLAPERDARSRSCTSGSVHPSTHSKPLIQEALQTKTKAKTRYLKAKKERRKKRKALNVPLAAAKPASNVQGRSGSSEETSSDGETSSEGQSMVQLPAAAKLSVSEAEVTKPLKKRRKYQAGSSDERMDVDQPPALEQGPALDTGQEEATPLLSFPVPTQPEPPSRSTLARQALSQSLAHAEVIDPQTTISLLEENHVARRLSARMRKRLGELGINELFASKPLCSSQLGYSPTLIFQFRLLSSRFSSPIRAQDQTPIDLMILQGTSSQVPQRGVAKHWHM
jgi:hypothetical protein